MLKLKLAPEMMTPTLRVLAKLPQPARGTRIQLRPVIYSHLQMSGPDCDAGLLPAIDVLHHPVTQRLKGSAMLLVAGRPTMYCLATAPSHRFFKPKASQ